MDSSTPKIQAGDGIPSPDVEALRSWMRVPIRNTLCHAIRAALGHANQQPNFLYIDGMADREWANVNAQTIQLKYLLSEDEHWVAGDLGAVPIWVIDVGPGHAKVTELFSTT